VSAPASRAAGAAELRRAFDHAFAAAASSTSSSATLDYLAVAVAGDAYAVRTTDVSGLFADRAVVPLPSSPPELLGMAGFRGVLTPVYDLAALLGYPPAGTGPNGGPRWLIGAAGPVPLALAFDRLDGYLRVSPEAVSAVGAAATEQPAPRVQHVRGIVRAEGVVRPIVDLPSLVAALRQRVPAGAPRGRSER